MWFSTECVDFVDNITRKPFVLYGHTGGKSSYLTCIGAKREK